MKISYKKKVCFDQYEWIDKELKSLESFGKPVSPVFFAEFTDGTTDTIPAKDIICIK